MQKKTTVPAQRNYHLVKEVNIQTVIVWCDKCENETFSKVFSAWKNQSCF